MSNKDMRRRILGALLGGALGFGFGFGGGWEWLLTLNLPILPSASQERFFYALTSGFILCGSGLVWGSLVAWPERDKLLVWALKVALGISAIGVAVILVAELLPMDLFWLTSGVSGYLFLFSPFVIFLVISLMFRRILAALGKVRSANIALLILFVGVVGLALTWPLVGITDSEAAVKAFRLTNRYAQEQQWDSYTIDLVMMDSAFWDTRIHLPTGSVIACEGYPYSTTVTCQP